MINNLILLHGGRVSKMTEPEFYELELINWEKYNPRKDIKKPSWFCLHNDLFLHDVLGNLSPQEVKVWLFILCERSRQNKKVIKVSENSVKRYCKVYAKFLHSLIKVLKREKMVRVVSDCNVDESHTEYVRDGNATIQDNTLHNTNTPVVPLRGRRISKRQTAVQIRTLILGAVRKVGDDSEKAKEIIGDVGWKILHQKYPAWGDFCRNYVSQSKAGKQTIFEHQLKETLIAGVYGSEDAHAL